MYRIHIIDMIWRCNRKISVKIDEPDVEHFIVEMLQFYIIIIKYVTQFTRDTVQ